MKISESMTTPELSVVNVMAAFNPPVLLRLSRLDIAMTDAGCLECEDEREWKLGPVVTLELANREWHRRLDLAEEVKARVLIEPQVQTEHAQTRAIVQRGVLVDGFALELDDLSHQSGRRRPVRPSRTASAVAAGDEAISWGYGMPMSRNTRWMVWALTRMPCTRSHPGDIGYGQQQRFTEEQVSHVDQPKVTRKG
jgi:hypothetical protein